MPSLPASLTRRVHRYFWYFAMPLMGVTTSIIYLNDKVLEVTRIDGESMSPTLSRDFHTTGDGDYLLWRKWNPTAHIRRGDVVHFGSPVRPEANAVKRVVALEGDTVLLDPRRRPRRERDGADLPESRSWDQWPGRRATVPEGHVWVEGDNWRNSSDSNYYGPISKSLILGKAVAVVLPWKSFGEKPWEGFQGRTRVVPAFGKKKKVDDLALILQ